MPAARLRPGRCGPPRPPAAHPRGRQEIRSILAEADENEDGVLEYREFLPVMVQIVYALRARNAAVEQREREDADAREAAETFLLRGVPRENLERIMARRAAPPLRFPLLPACARAGICARCAASPLYTPLYTPARPCDSKQCMFEI